MQYSQIERNIYLDSNVSPTCNLRNRIAFAYGDTVTCSGKVWLNNMKEYDSLTIIDTHEGEAAKVADTLIEGRKNMVASLSQLQHAEVTIYVQAYDRLEKTKMCIESILENTRDIDYELLLVDNGSTDETLNYFKTIPYPKKRIIHITKNIGAAFPSLLMSPYECSPFMAFLGNDIIVTPNWLSNIISGMKSDERIGMVCPSSSHVSNLQEVNFPFENYEEMQQKAAAYNRPDTSKWQERLRLITPLAVYRKECLLAIGLPVADMGFFHDFMDDDVVFRVRRAGYKAMLAMDTWVHHNHDVFRLEGKDPEKFQESLDIGRSNFLEKYHGIDAWEDVNNFWMDMLAGLPKPDTTECVRILGVDVRCGTPILDVKNYLHSMGMTEFELSAFTEDAKYLEDLNTFCNGIVSCDREEFFGNQYPSQYFDYIIIDKPINRFHEPQYMLNTAMRLLKPGGVLLLSHLNPFSIRELLYCLGQRQLYNPQFSYNIPIDALQKACLSFGDILFLRARPIVLEEASKEQILALLPDPSLLPDLLVETYILGIEKYS